MRGGNLDGVSKAMIAQHCGRWRVPLAERRVAKCLDPLRADRLG